MIFLTEEMIKNLPQIEDYIEKSKNRIKNHIQFEQKQKDIILNYMQKFANSTNDIDLNYVDTILKILEILKNSLAFCNENIALLENFLQKLDNILSIIKNTSFETIQAKINDLNVEYDKMSEMVLQNTMKREEDALYMSSFLELQFPKATNHTVFDNTFLTTSKDQAIKNLSDYEEYKIVENSPNDEESKKGNHYIENALIISETSGEVTLPYSLSKLKEQIKNNQTPYETVDDIISQNYTLPLSLFKNPFISRFREAFKLMRVKENKSIKESFDLGMELMFNYNLHPAIISACKNLDELDIYLDYLENGETQKFDCFKIIFKVAPTIIKEKNQY